MVEMRVEMRVVKMAAQLVDSMVDPMVASMVESKAVWMVLTSAELLAVETACYKAESTVDQ